jgi:hypothetical protein
MVVEEGKPVGVLTWHDPLGFLSTVARRRPLSAVMEADHSQFHGLRQGLRRATDTDEDQVMSVS